jgi:hypothetical protein
MSVVDARSHLNLLDGIDDSLEIVVSWLDALNKALRNGDEVDVRAHVSTIRHRVESTRLSTRQIKFLVNQDLDRLEEEES